MSRADPTSLLYDAAIGETEWQGAIAAISKMTDGSALLLGIGDNREPSILEHWSFGIDTSILAAAAELESADIFKPVNNPEVRASLGIPVGRSVDSRAFVPEREARQIPLYRALTVQGYSQRRLFTAIREGTLQAGGFIAGRGGKALGGSAARAFDRVVPHIGRALRLRNEIGRHRGIETSLQNAFDSLSTSVLVIDLDLRILLANAHADVLLAANDGLTSTRGRLAIAKPVRDRFLTAVRGTHRRNGAAPASAIPAPRPSGRSPYLLRIFPAIGTGNLAGAAAACATVIIHDPAAPAALPEPTQLSDALGLTPAEAAVARLVPLAESKRVMAERLGISENTVKTHLTAIRAKLDVQNATELARVVQAATVIGRPFGPSR